MARDLLQNADRAVKELGLDRRLVIDADVHHLAVLKYLGPFVDARWRRVLESAPFPAIKPSTIGEREVADRIKRPPTPPFNVSVPPTAITTLVQNMARMGVDYSVAFPGDLLQQGDAPDRDFEVAVATGYARWLTDCVLPYEPRVKALLYLPMKDPRACVALIEEFGARPGIVGALMTGTRPDDVHGPAYTAVYRALEEQHLALGIHSGTAWWGQPWNLFDRFLGVHALHFPTYNSIHLINMVMNGVPERFPDLRLIFFEAGAAIMPLVMARLDTAFLMRPSEAPLLRRRPSDYMREFFYTIQPIETPERPDQMRIIFDQIGRSQILFATDYPHWDFDMPSSIANLNFLSEDDKDAIFFRNAVRAFGLNEDELTLVETKSGAEQLDSAPGPHS